MDKTLVRRKKLGHHVSSVHTNANEVILFCKTLSKLRNLTYRSLGLQASHAELCPFPL